MRTDIFQSEDGHSHRTVEVHCAATCFRVFQHVHHINLIPAFSDGEDDCQLNEEGKEESAQCLPALSLGAAASSTAIDSVGSSSTTALPVTAEEWLTSEPQDPASSEMPEWHVDMTISCSSDSPRGQASKNTTASPNASPVLQVLSSPNASPVLQALSSPLSSPARPMHASPPLVPVEEACAYMYICTSLQQAMDCFLEMVSRALAANMQHAFPTCELALGSDAFRLPRPDGLLFLQELRRYADACHQLAAEQGDWTGVAASPQFQQDAQNLCGCIENYVNKTHVAGMLVTQLQSYEVVNIVLALGLQLPLTPSNPWYAVVSLELTL
jgi:hypothetical protein